MPTSTSAPLVVPAPPDPDALDALVARVNATARSSTLGWMLEVGELVVSELYDDDLEGWSARREKAAPYTALASHPSLHLTKNDLSRSVRLFELDARLRAAGHVGVQECGLPVSHLYIVLGLPFVDQRKLLDTALDKGWNRKQLQDRATKVRGELGGPAGRPPLPRFQKTIHSFRKIVADPEEAFGDLDALDTMEPEDATALFQTLSALTLQIDAIVKRLRSRVTALDED